MSSPIEKTRNHDLASDVDSRLRATSERTRRSRSPRPTRIDDDSRRRGREEDYAHRRSNRNASNDERPRYQRREAQESRHRDRPRTHRRERSVSVSSAEERRSRRERMSSDRSRSREQLRSYQRQMRSRSPPRKKHKSLSRSRSPPSRRSRGPLPPQNESFTQQLPSGERLVEKQKPNFKPTGLLAKEANTVAGTATVLKYHEPPEARKPSSKEQWRLYVFKKKDLLDTVLMHEQSVWLIGRDQKVTDLLLEHPSISKQHAVIQFRYITSTNEYGDRSSRVKPYLIDLESANGTKLNGKKVQASRFIELVDRDVISFGDSEREYVVMLPSAAK